MINRALIRSKVLQMLYAYHQGDSQDPRKALQEFRMSLDKSYELYHYLLLLIPEITHYADNLIEMRRNKYLPTEEEQHPNTRFIDNRLAEQIRCNKALSHYAHSHALTWSQSESFVRKAYEQIILSPAYIEYMQQDAAPTYEDDKELWRRLFKAIVSSDDLAEALEESSIYWNDDVDIVGTFVLKTIRQFEEGSGDSQPLLPKFKDKSDEAFADKLFENALRDGDSYNDLIVGAVKNWDMERITTIDRLILQIALTEILTIDDIPLNVSFNEYIDLAKIYSTEKSSVFINGTLDNLVQTLRSENKLFKS